MNSKDTCQSRLLKHIFLMARAFSPRAGSDHFYHVGLINGIRGNGHKFVRSYPNLIGEKYFMYPQFYHWLISFLSSKIIEKYYWFLGVTISFLQLIFFLMFAYTIYPFVQTDISVEQFMLLSGLIFKFTPFSYAIWNAKNTGISVRGFGLFLGQMYLYLITWYYLFDNILFFMAAFVIGFIIIISSQFAMQFVFFSAPMFALFFKNPFFLLIPVFALSMFYLIMPEIARNFMKGQINYKFLYYKYLADKHILRLRYSIWRDLFWDLWVKRFPNWKEKVLYIWYNPFLAIIWGFPFLILFLVYWLFADHMSGTALADKTTYYLGWPIAISFIVFLLTSFRKTRFLGEPERYMEFSIPYISVLGATLFAVEKPFVYLVLFDSFCLALVQMLWQHLHAKYGNVMRSYETLVKIKEILYTIRIESTSEVRIFSNNDDIGKQLLDGTWKVLRINLTEFHTGRFNFKDIFPSQYPYVAPNVILPLIKAFHINCFILDVGIFPDYEKLLKDSDVSFVEKASIENYKIFKVCSKN